MADSSPESLLRWALDAIFAGGFVVTALKLRAERRLTAAQAESEEAQADKAKSEAHRFDIESMSDVVRAVKEQWTGERETWKVKEQLFEKQIKDLSAEKRCLENERDELIKRVESNCQTVSDE